MFFTFFRRTFRLPSKIAKIREIVQSILTLLAIVDVTIAAAKYSGPLVAQFIRVIILIVIVRGLREAIKRITLVIYDSKEILFMVIGYVILFGWVGHRLFRGTQEGEAYFSSLLESVYNMFILLTTANYPDIMIPAYEDNKMYALFFVTYLIIGLFFLMNLVLAIYYSNYKNRVENTINKFIDIRENFLIETFEIYDEGEKGYLTKKE